MEEPQSEIHDALVEFYKGRRLAPDVTVYNETGDLVKYALIKKKGGAIEQGVEEFRISLPSYRPPTKEELEAQEAERKERIEQAEGAFEGARRELRALIKQRAAIAAGEEVAAAEGEEGGGASTYASLTEEILLKNIELADLDSAVKDARSALQLVVPYRRKVPRTMLFIDDSREDTNVPLVNVLVRRPFTLQQSYVRVQEEGAGISKKKRKAAAVTEAPALEAVRVRVVKPTIEGVNGFLNPWFPAPVTYKGQGYLHAYQAAMASVAELLGDAEAAAQIRLATTPEAMTYVPKEGIAPETYNRVLAEILFATTTEKFKQNPELGIRLLQTGTDRIVIVPPGNPLDTVLGAGLDIKNPDIKDPGKWTGQNRLGFYIEQVRNRMAAERAEAKTAAAAAMEAAISTAGDAGAAMGAAGAGAAAALAATTGVIADAATGAAAAAGDAFADAFDAIGDVLGVGGEEEAAPAAAPAAAAVAAAGVEELPEVLAHEEGGE